MKKAFTLAELCTVIVILGIIAAVVVKIAFKTPQGQFDIKYDKTASAISSNIQAGMMKRTGFQFADYNGNNNAFFDDVTNNLNGTGNGITIANSWSSNINIDGTNIANYRAFRMNDETVIAIDNAGTNIFIDVNGRKGPNQFGRDIYQYDNAAPARRNLVGGGGEEPGGGGEPQGCVDPGHAETNATWSYDSTTCTWTPSCSGNYTLSGNSCVCNLAQKTENNIIYTADSTCNYQATACATTSSSDSTYTYSYSMPNCNATKTGCVNTRKKLSNGNCVCKNSYESGDNCQTCTYTTGCTVSVPTKIYKTQYGYVAGSEVSINCCTANLNSIAVYAAVKKNKELLAVALNAIKKCESAQQSYTAACPNSTK